MTFDIYHAPDAGDDLTATEAVLAQLITEYRVASGLPAVTLSRSLSLVGNRHGEDILYNLGGVQPSAPGTNAAHSWSDSPYDATNSATYKAIWEAPERLGTSYPGYGFEILFSYLAPHTATVEATPSEALGGWQGSPGHNAVILNLPPWDPSYLTWGGLGIGMLHGVAGAWFGHEADPSGSPDVRLQGAYGEYSVTVTVGSIAVVDSVAARDPSFTIPNASKLKFSDGSYDVATQSFTATPPPAAPVVTAQDVTATAAGQVFAAAILFSATDANGDALTYEFWDGTDDAASGHWLLNGVVQAANTVFAATDATLGTLSFVVGSRSDALYVRAFDGTTTTEWVPFLIGLPPSAAISADQSVSEAVVRVSFTITLDAAPSAPVSVAWSVVDGSATVADHDMPAGQSGQVVTFAPGDPLSKSITVLVNDEAHKQEGSESFSVVVGAANGVTIGRASASVTLVDDYIAPPALPVMMTNTTTSTNSTPAVADYTGPLSYLADEFVYLGTDSISVNCVAPNVFLRSGSGDDALAVAAGQNVLDAGTGSNFLTGGVGADTFFLDARGAGAAIWSTIVGLNAGDAVTLWGVTLAGFAIDWFEGQGAAGYTGLTMHATAIGQPTVSLTLAGFTDADRGNGRLAILFGNDPGSGSDYMYVFAYA